MISDLPLFTPRQCEALYANVLVDDKIDAMVELPDTIHLDYEQDQFLQCYRICRQVWKEGIDRASFAQMVSCIFQRRTITPEEALAFKHIRAKFKHLRFAYATFGETHRYPRLFDLSTRAMGSLQDAFKNGQPALVARYAVLLRLLLTPLPYAIIRREIDGFRPTNNAELRRYLQAQIQLIRDALAKPKVTAKEFHHLRKIISRQVSFYDSLKVLYPSIYHDKISRYLSAINGMMGGMHDDLVAMKLSGEQDYHKDEFVMPPEIARRLQALADRYTREPGFAPAHASTPLLA